MENTIENETQLSCWVVPDTEILNFFPLQDLSFEATFSDLNRIPRISAKQQRHVKHKSLPNTRKG
jgi:hypothetical protein